MERYCLTGQSPQRAVAPTEKEEEVNDWNIVPGKVIRSVVSLIYLNKKCVLADTIIKTEPHFNSHTVITVRPLWPLA
jgi:hypothetical protein